MLAGVSGDGKIHTPIYFTLEGYLQEGLLSLFFLLLSDLSLLNHHYWLRTRATARDRGSQIRLGQCKIRSQPEKRKEREKGRKETLSISISVL